MYNLDEAQILSILGEAFIFAAKKHENQKRKFTGESYIVHPAFVASVLIRHMDDLEILQAALLHDTIEDTDTTYNEVVDKFGIRVANLVKELTVDEEGKKILGKKKYMALHFNTISNDALTIKLVDRLHNILGLLDNKMPEDFVKWYWKETVYVFEKLDRDLTELQQSFIFIINELLDYIALLKFTK